jgi:hypothetical protein
MVLRARIKVDLIHHVLLDLRLHTWGFFTVHSCEIREDAPQDRLVGLGFKV